MKKDSAALVWFRRDLRDFDHAALAAALREAGRVHCAFVFDTDILAGLPKADRRVDFIHRAVLELDAALRAKGGGLIIRHGRAVEEIPRLAAQLGVASVHANRDHEPFARRRDAAVAARLSADGRRFIDHKDQTIFERDEISTREGKPFSVFTPYARAWRARLAPADLAEHRCQPRPDQLVAPRAGLPALTLEEIGFVPTDLKIPCGMSGGARLFEDFLTRIERYRETRDYPAVKGVSYLSPHLRFGTVSIRRLVAAALERSLTPEGAGAKAWLDELIWREFYQMILWQRPDVVDHCYRREFDALVWDEAPELFAAWCEGRTGYPLVDAAQRQLLQTGWMHNRLRMVSASFLTKDLGIDWRRGEAHFARWLLDYELASNNGGWQWAAGTGCDAQPWFRIFNPVTQAQKFDPQGRFIRRYVPELSGVPDEFIHAPWQMPTPPLDYPPPIVDHAAARQRTLARFGRLRAPV
ncbi:cryptochrome/photolyase family protein [Sulfuricystis multivorans]|uniref:cryptochrome/photolyase family protein n=1 Tax=Sulfuricystis multivorans TaxID=2211108 RepID=UPI000F82FA02|nr:deoxyribodipyrimidine photo-lyase [Sulfuricystis multivorans]